MGMRPLGNYRVHAVGPADNLGGQQPPPHSQGAMKSLETSCGADRRGRGCEAPGGPSAEGRHARVEGGATCAVYEAMGPRAEGRHARVEQGTGRALSGSAAKRTGTQCARRCRGGRCVLSVSQADRWRRGHLARGPGRSAPPQPLRSPAAPCVQTSQSLSRRTY